MPRVVLGNFAGHSRVKFSARVTRWFMQALCARLALLTPKASLTPSGTAPISLLPSVAILQQPTSRTHRYPQARSPTRGLRSALIRPISRANQVVKITQAAQDTASQCKSPQALTGKLPTQASSLCPLVPQPPPRHVQFSLSTGRPRPPILRPYSNQTPLRKLESHRDAAAHAVLCVTSPRSTTKFHNSNKHARKESKSSRRKLQLQELTQHTNSLHRSRDSGARNTQPMSTHFLPMGDNTRPQHQPRQLASGGGYAVAVYGLILWLLVSGWGTSGLQLHLDIFFLPSVAEGEGKGGAHAAQSEVFAGGGEPRLCAEEGGAGRRRKGENGERGEGGMNGEKREREHEHDEDIRLHPDSLRRVLRIAVGHEFCVRLGLRRSCAVRYGALGIRAASDADTPLDKLWVVVTRADGGQAGVRAWERN
ncbi:hypothetical protein K438DRAFT_1939845 [Mycena galopus ATCC 62051]|nr:hypothetical protein K438DRAFT_1939845 [Mycena galopus ATCC 62051]